MEGEMSLFSQYWVRFPRNELVLAILGSI
uniref:Uncharacterized protein n=1 Tax=Ciona savignyi TaxID=51511 RepID=H2YCH8_CIOSA